VKPVKNVAKKKPGTFVVTIRNNTKHGIEPGYLVVPPKEWYRTEEVKCVEAGDEIEWELDYVPTEVTVTRAQEFVGPANAPATKEKELPKKTLKLGVDYKKDSGGVTITYP
jgi:hypothetical protein